MSMPSGCTHDTGVSRRTRSARRARHDVVAEHVASHLDGGGTLLRGSIDDARLRVRRPADRRVVGVERDGRKHRVHEAPEARPARALRRARQFGDLDVCRRCRERVIQADARRVRGPGRCRLKLDALTAACGDRRVAIGAPALVFGQAIFDGEHVAVLHDQVVPHQPER
jgi:hypothetical protein